jgi:hypothetical protein
MVAPVTVWAVRIGVSNEDAEGTLTLEESHLVFDQSTGVELAHLRVFLRPDFAPASRRVYPPGFSVADRGGSREYRCSESSALLGRIPPASSWRLAGARCQCCVLCHGFEGRRQQLPQRQA